MGVWIEIANTGTVSADHVVTPCVGVWIEIGQVSDYARNIMVTPCVGVWIEIDNVYFYDAKTRESLPVWECGLKYSLYVAYGRQGRHSLCGSVD